METSRKTETKSSFNNTSITIRMTSELKEQINYFALKDEITPSQLIRDIIIKEMKSRQLN
jgi:predicted DNA-binding protein